MNRRAIFYFLRHSLEGVVWIVALVLLALDDPQAHHYTLCPLNNLGLDFCPGCGLGRSITAFFKANLKASWHYHPLGIFAVLVLVYRIITIFRNSIRNFKMKTKIN